MQTDATYHWRGVVARVRLLAELLVLLELAVRDMVHQVRHLLAGHLLGAHPTWVSEAAHLIDQVRPALEWEKKPRRDMREGEPG